MSKDKPTQDSVEEVYQPRGVMQFFRDPKVMKITMAFVFIVTIPAFILLYGYGDTEGGTREVVFGSVVLQDGAKKNITVDDMREAKSGLAMYYVGLYQLMTGQQATQQFYNAMERSLSERDIARFAVAQLALRQRMESQGVIVSNDQVIRQLKESGVTREQFSAMLASRRMSEGEYFLEQTAALTSQRSFETVQNLARTSLIEQWNFHLLQNEKLSVTTVTVPSQSYMEQVAITPEEIKAEYDRIAAESPRELDRPAERIYEYVLSRGPALRRPPQPTEAQILEEYVKMMESDPSLNMGKGIIVRHVLIGLNPATATEEQKTAARSTAEVARQRVLSGEDFSVVAEEFTTDPRSLMMDDMATSPTMNGGRLRAPITGDEVIAWGTEYLNFLNTAPLSDLSPVIETPQGYVVGRAEDRSDALTRPLQDVRAEIINKIQTAEQEKLTKAREGDIAAMYDELRRTVAQESTLRGIAEHVGSDVQETSPTLESSMFITGIGNLDRERGAIEDLRRGEISPPLRTSADDFVIMHLKEIIPTRMQTLEEATPRIESKLRQDRTAELARARANEIAGQIRAGTPIAEAAGDLALQAVTEPFARPQLPTELFQAINFASDTIGVKDGDVLVLDHGFPGFVMGAMVVQVDTVETPTREQFLADQKQAELYMLTLRRHGYLQDFLVDAERELKATFNEKLLGEG